MEEEIIGNRWKELDYDGYISRVITALPYREGPDCYQRLEFFIQVLRVLCPNLTDASLVVSRVPRLVSVISLFVRASLASPSVTLLSSPYHPARRDRAGGEEDG